MAATGASPLIEFAIADLRLPISNRDCSEWQIENWKLKIENEIGGIAQLAEHELCKLGVAGSNPVASTMLRSQRSGERSMPCEALGGAGPSCDAIVK